MNIKSNITYSVGSDRLPPGISDEAVTLAEFSLAAGIFARFQEKLSVLAEPFSAHVWLDIDTIKNKCKLSLRILDGSARFYKFSLPKIDIKFIEAKDHNAIFDRFLIKLRDKLDGYDRLDRPQAALYDLIKESRLGANA